MNMVPIRSCVDCTKPLYAGKGWFKAKGEWLYVNDCTQPALCRHDQFERPCGSHCAALVVVKDRIYIMCESTPICYELVEE